jgi:1,4-alpha-glucan branching enzyme
MTYRGKAAGRVLAAALTAVLALGGCGKAVSADNAFARPSTPVAAQAATRNLDAWRDENIYFILTDRFSNGDKSNDANVNTNDPNAFHGGDFQGIINKLPYIKGLGATTIWITPIQQNKPDSLVGKYWGYHGYWISDWEKIDQRLGTDAKFAELVNAAGRCL